MNRDYTAEEDEIIRRCYKKGLGPKRISYSYLTNRSPRSISMRVQRLRVQDQRVVRPKTISITFAISLEDRVRIREAAHATNHSVSTFIRNAVFEKLK